MTRDHQDRNVYVLGAGFSAPAGAPVVGNFLDKSREFYDDPLSGLDGEEEKQFERVFLFRQQMAAAREKFVIDLDNIEHLFGLIEISDRLGEIEDGLRNDVIYLIAKTLQLAVTRPVVPRPKINVGIKSVTPLLDRIANPQGGVFRDEGAGNFTADIYDYFAALVAGALDNPTKRLNRKDTIITFNYDLVCDDAIRRVGFQPNYHLPHSAAGPDIDPAASVDVLKLHGSTNWAVCGNCDAVQVLEQKFTENPAAFRAMVCPVCGKGPCELLLVPPSWDKSEYRQIIRSVWARAVTELTRATRLCIVGYSMPEVDAFFRYLLTIALARNNHLYKLIVVDSNPEMEARYQSVFDRTFQQRRFVFRGTEPSSLTGVPNLAGITQFLGSKESIEQLGRAESVSGHVTVIPYRAR